MKIIGGRDYYDAGVAYGRDETLVFVRDKIEPLDSLEVPLECPSMQVHYGNTDQWRDYRRLWRSNYCLTRLTGPLHVRPITLWFAGKRHAGVMIEQDPTIGLPKVTPSYFWSEETFRAWLESINQLPSASSWVNGDRNIKSHFQSEGSAAHLKWIIDNRYAIAWAIGVEPHSRQKVEWHLNATGLDKLQFYKKMDIMTAWQELSMFLSSTAPSSGNDMVTITDQKIKRDKHGFDEWSFKKRKQT
jgi:hypothetical protein